MAIKEQIDALYEAFSETLPLGLQGHAHALPHRLGLAPTPEVRWSEVFGNEVTLGAPALVAEAAPHVPGAVVRDAHLAHMLAIIEAFGTDRIQDEQIAGDEALVELLARMRGARDDALRRVHDPSADPTLDFARADVRSRQAMAMEHEIMRDGRPTLFVRYHAISLAKQSVGFPACLALARTAGWNDAKAGTLNGMLASVWLGLQFYDDVVDWEDDYERGGAWAVALARGSYLDTNPRDRPTERNPIQRLVFSSGVMARMLRDAHRQFRAARKRASVLGATQLSAWARTKEIKMRQLADKEAASAGFALREQALRGWASEVFA